MRHDKEIPPFEVEEELARLKRVENAATQLFIPIWRALLAGQIPDRSPVDDAALRLRDALNPHWPANPDWLPEPLARERKDGNI